MWRFVLGHGAKIREDKDELILTSLLYNIRKSGPRKSMCHFLNYLPTNNKRCTSLQGSHSLKSKKKKKKKIKNALY